MCDFLVESSLIELMNSINENPFIVEFLSGKY